MEKENRFPENLKTLREAWGETQDDLAKIASPEKPFTRGYISQWESGKGEPKNDALMRIANHYQVTVNQLLYADLSDLGSIKFNGTKNSLARSFLIILPFITSPEAENDPTFKKALVMMQQLWIKLDKELHEREWTVPNIIDCYQASFRTNKTIEAACNIICCLMLNFIVIANPNVFEKIYLYQPDADISSFLKDIALGKYKLLTEDEVEQRDYLIYKNEKALDYYLRKIKQSVKYSDFADYYLGLRYVVGYVNNNYGNLVNSVIGIEMLEQFANWGNSYAQEYLEYRNKVVSITDDK